MTLILHGLRASIRPGAIHHASWLLAGGADLTSVMDRMGHSLIQTTQKYLHALPDADQRSLDAFTRITDPPSPGSTRRTSARSDPRPPSTTREE
jgi:integrase